MGMLVARMGVMRNTYKFWSDGLRGRYHLAELGLGGRIITEWILGSRSQWPRGLRHVLPSLAG
jgi:hypothetical protein